MALTIGIYITDFSKGGAQKQSILLAYYLSEHYHCEYIVASTNGDYFSLASEKKIKITVIGKGFFKHCFSLYKLFKKNKIDILITYLPIGNILGGIIGKLAGVKIIYGGIRISKTDYPLWKIVIQKWLCNYLSTGFISNSHCAKAKYSKLGFKESKISVIHNCIDTNKIKFRK
ncbi:MAG: glycosyltransferase [Chloroflexia bacterium]|nr:glycosyltransferase [Chloroflexia bacterium]